MVHLTTAAFATTWDHAGDFGDVDVSTRGSESPHSEILSLVDLTLEKLPITATTQISFP